CLCKGALCCRLLQCYCSLCPANLGKSSQRLLAANIVDLRLHALCFKRAIGRKLLLDGLKLGNGIGLCRASRRRLSKRSLSSSNS
ncbi:hypothetical protein SB767_33335, partial [Bacillus sp. SIMBA_069]